MKLEQRIRGAEAELFAAVGAEPEESFHELAATGLRVRVLSHGSGAPVLLLHGVSLGAAAWAPLFEALPGHRLLALDLPGHGLSEPARYRRGQVREHACDLIDDVFDALGLDEAPASAGRRSRARARSAATAASARVRPAARPPARRSRPAARSARAGRRRARARTSRPASGR